MELYIWIAVFVALAAIEFATAQLTTIWFAFGALLAVIACALGADAWLQWAVFLLSSVLLLLFTRRIVMRFLRAAPQPTNTDRIIGSVGIVTEEIDNLKATGYVSIGAAQWSARSENEKIIPVGETVVIKRIEGVKVIVEKQTKED